MTNSPPWIQPLVRPSRLIGHDQKHISNHPHLQWLHSATVPSCTTSPFVEYAVKANGVADYKATLAFAAKRNIRLVIRNTGHDYFGRSTGAGALALWTHFLKDTRVISDYISSAYTGPAMKIGAGVQGFEATAAADKAGLAVVNGECDTVGIAGGFTQGAGLGPLSSLVGLAADQVLEWEVVTAKGKHIVATPTKHEDLYWALSGGGGGTYAAVISLTLRVHKTMKVAGATLSFSGAGVSPSAFTDAVKMFLSQLPSYTDAGIWSSFLMLGNLFLLKPIFAPRLETSKLQVLLDPFLTHLNKSGIVYNYNIKEFPTFKNAYETLLPRNNVTNANIGGRLILSSVLDSPGGINGLMNAFQAAAESGAGISGVVSSQGQFPLGGVRNSVNPALRSSIISVVIGLPYDDQKYATNIGTQKTITQKIMPTLVEASPGGGSYLNEGDINEPNWQEAFYGDNYAKLSNIKDKYDPCGLFYGQRSVGSDRWHYHQNTDGRLFRTR